MDHSVACRGFQPPAPMSMAGYFDQVTGGLPSDVSRLFGTNRMERMISVLRSRRDPAERAALLMELERRFKAYGLSKGYLVPPPPRTPDESADLVTTFIVKDVLGLSGGSVDAKVLGEFKKQLKGMVKEMLNRKGRSGFQLLEFLWDLCNCRNTEEAMRVLMKHGNKQFAAYVKANWQTLMRGGMKAVNVSAVMRNRLLKLMAVRLAWASKWVARLRWLSPVVTGIEILFTSTSTATDFEMDRLAFLAVYGRILSDRGDAIGNLVDSCAGTEWKYKMPIEEAIKQSSRLEWRAH